MELIMGACTFTVVESGDSAKMAFSLARDKALHEYGHGGYTGSIAEKDSFVLISHDVLASFNDANSLADELIDNGDPRIDDKWGPAGCIKYLSGDKIKYLFFGWASS
jgi:hypothetical protein